MKRTLQQKTLSIASSPVARNERAKALLSEVLGYDALEAVTGGKIGLPRY
ncbi:MAG: hypothetical protein H7138_25285 [Myxococcales bacterium]|nr:hypothetical protein [Myxococcales bacterium]